MQSKSNQLQSKSSEPKFLTKSNKLTRNLSNGNAANFGPFHKSTNKIPIKHIHNEFDDMI